MEQLEFFQVPSPCVGVCSSDDKGYCNGCMRKREERFNWMSMTPSEQLHVIALSSALSKEDNEAKKLGW